MKMTRRRFDATKRPDKSRLKIGVISESRAALSFICSKREKRQCFSPANSAVAQVAKTLVQIHGARKCRQSRSSQYLASAFVGNNDTTTTRKGTRKSTSGFRAGDGEILLTPAIDDILGN